MSVTETEARIKSRIWQAIAQSDLDFSTVDKSVIESLVNLTTESALVEIDDTLGKSLTDARASGLKEALADEDEDLLWEGRPFLSLILRYKITDERIIVIEGLLGKTIENIELVRIQDVDYTQSFGERLINIGDINIRSNDKSHPTAQLKNVQNPAEVHEILRRAVLSARKKHNFTYREEM